MQCNIQVKSKEEKYKRVNEFDGKISTQGLYETISLIE